MTQPLASSTSPFSLTFTIQQSETQQGEQATLQEAFGNAAQVGNTISFFWDWSADSQLPSLTADVKLAQALGFKVVVNMTVNQIPGIAAPQGYAPTFADPATAQKYVSDVAYLASLKPTYLNIYPEVNVLAQFNKTEYDNFQKIYTTAYNAAKSASPTTLVGTSLLDVLWVGYHQQALPDQLGPHDFIGITTYPFNIFPQVSDIPSNWYTQWRVAYPTARLLFTEVGWGSAAPLSPDNQATFISALPQLMQQAAPEVIAYALQYDGTFYKVSDLTPSQLLFYKSLGTDPNVLFNEFNNSGLFNADGTPKPAWFAAKNLVFNFPANSGAPAPLTAAGPASPLPPPTSALALAPTSDSGVQGDNITNVTQPAITGTGVAGDTVSLYDGSALIGTATVKADGTWSVTPGAALASGVHTLTTTQTDAAGNVSAASSALSLTISTQANVSPSAPNIVANVANPVIAGTAGNGATVSIAIDGAVVGTAMADVSTGAWTFQVPQTLAQGMHTVTEQASDAAGTVSAGAATHLFVAPDPASSATTPASATAPILLYNVLGGQAASLQFLPGTEAVRLSDGILSVGPDTAPAYIARLNQGLFGHAEDMQGMGFWASQIVQGASLSDVATGFLNTPEGQAATSSLTDPQYIDHLYHGLLGRSSGTAETAYWTNALSHGGTRGQVLADIANSGEAKTNLAAATQNVFVPAANAEQVIFTYETAFGREPDAGGFNYSIALLNHGVSAQDFNNVFVSSSEFQSVHQGQTGAALLASLYQFATGHAPTAADLAPYGSGAQTSASLLALVAQSPAAAANLQSKL